MGRGRLRVYLGAAPGVGKTFAALDEARRLASNGVDVVIGFVETHGRAETGALTEGLEKVPRRAVEYRGASFEEMDVTAVLARKPEVALVDELAHTNIPGSGNEKRWQDVEQMLAAGIDVISTVNIQHLQSLNDVITEITGVAQQEIIPDEVVRRADEIELVDLTQEAIRDRMAAGKIYPQERVDAALANFFRPGNLGALRELALSWTADRVDEALDRYRRDHGIDDQWETRERVVVGITGAEGGEFTILRAARMAMRSRGQLIGVHVRSADGLTGFTSPLLDRQRDLLLQLGGEYYEMSGPEVAESIVGFALSHNATQLVVGATRRGRWERFLRGSIIEDVVRRAKEIDVHVISDPDRPHTAKPRRAASSLPKRRQAAGYLAALATFAVATPLLLIERGNIALQNVLLIYLLVAVVAAWTGGIGPALAAGIVGFTLGNYLFTPPYGTWTVESGQDVFALVAFVVVSGAMGGLVSLTSRRATQVRQAHAEAETLAALATAADTESLDELLVRMQVALDLDGITVFHPTRDALLVGLRVGPRPPESIEAADRTAELHGAVLALAGGPFTGTEERLLRAFVAQIGSSVNKDLLATEAAEAAALSRADELRTSLLRAVSHDLRSPLSGIKASVSSLLEEDVTWSPEQVREFLQATYAETLRLDHVVADLLDASRIQAGVVKPRIRPVGIEEVVAGALVGVGSSNPKIEVDVSETLPRVMTDPSLLERILENLIRNAVQHAPDAASVTIDAGLVGDHRLDLRVIDHGPGVPAQDRERMFQPFQRLDDAAKGGVGLGLAVAKGLCDALGHELVVEDTQGGGTTMVVSFLLDTS